MLTKLNDIVRLCSVMEPTRDPLNQLFDVIRIETPFLCSQEATQTEQLGKLVIIDTPGPNEAGENLRLTAVVKDQLKRSSIVLIVLDYTQLNNEAAEQVKKQVQPIIDLIGKDNLYVLVNKVDQRRDGDMSTEDVKKFVYADLKFTDSSQTERVFEIAAIQAFCARKFLYEVKQKPDAQIEMLQTAEALAKETLGTRWESKLLEMTLKDLRKEADYLWQASGFNIFLEKAINALMESAAPRCMLSALNLSRNRLLSIRDNLKLRSSAIAKDEQKLRIEIDALEADLTRLELGRTQLKEVETIRASLQSNLKEILRVLKKEAQVSIQDYFVEEDYQRAEIIDKVGIATREKVLKPASNYVPFGLSKWLKAYLKDKLSNTIEFNTKQEADDFANEAISWAKVRAESLLYSTKLDTRNEIDKALNQLIIWLEKDANPIIDKARNRLNQEFDVKLSFPERPSWDDNHLKETQISANYAIRKNKIQYSDRKRRWYVLWLWKIEFSREKTIDEKYYYVSLESVIQTFNHSITQAVDNINSQMVQYLDEEFKEENDRYFDHLDEYLCNYRDSLKQAQQDQQLSLEQQDELKQNLSTLISGASNYVEKVDSYLERTQSLMPSEKLQ